MFLNKKQTAATSDHKVQRLTVSGRTEAVASSAQQRIYMHENLYFSASDFSVYNYVIPLIIKRGSVSIEHVRLSLVSVIQQHTVLRTAIRFNPIHNQIEQNIRPLIDDIYSFQYSRGVSTLEQLDRLLTSESTGKYFDVKNGKVLRCHVVQRSAVGNDDSLHEGDFIIFVIHHIAFDLTSYKPFLKAFERACLRNEYHQSVLTIPQYINFALYEQALLADRSAESKMNTARWFWANLMHGYDWDKIRYLVPAEDRTDRHHSGRGYSTSFTIDQDVVDAMMSFASTNNVTMFSLSLACYYIFLFKLTNHDNDLCVVSSAADRLEKETQDMIGMFVNLLLYRIKIEPNTTLKQLVQQIQQLNNEILEHAFLSYQQIVDSQGKREINVLPSMFFQYEPLKLAVTQKNSIELTLSEGSVTSGYYDRDLNHQNGISPFDMSLTIIHDHHTPSTECFWNCSADIFKHQDDVDILSKRFQHILTQLFSFPMLQQSIHKLNIVLPNEQMSLLESSDTQIFSSDPSIYTVLKRSTINRQMTKSEASKFWLDALHDCKLDQSLPLPYDRYHLANEHRTDRGTSISFDFGQDLSHDFLIHASSNNISLQHLTFAIYFIFLFKLTNGQTDLCVAMNINNNRYRDEREPIIGVFQNVIPLRCQLDPRWCLHQLLEHVQEITTNSMKYSYFPLQRILNQHPHISKHAFLDTSLEFISYKSNNYNNAIMIGDSQLVPGSFSFNVNEDEILSISDFSLSIYHDTNMNQLSCTINGSLDLFNRETVEKISQRFHFILSQLSASMIDNQMNKPIHELSLALPNEKYLMQSLNNTEISFPSAFTCIHHEFVYQVMKHPQKLAVELDEQSLTYCELLHYAQVLSLTLRNEYHVVPGEIICQCVERSLPMVIGIVAIEMSGGVYCPLSHRDPAHRLHALTQQTQSRLVLVHDLTKTKFDDDIVSFDINSILTVNNMEVNIDIDQLSSIRVALDDLAYIIFTSGSTGKPKAVQIQHKNFTEFMHSLVYGDVVNEIDTILQIGRCSYDAHVQDIMGTFMIGSSLIMLHPRGIIDFDYLASVFKEKNITCITTVPTIIHNFFTYMQQQNHHTVTQYLRSVCSAGEPCSLKLINLISNTVMHTCRLWNIYGPAETTIACTFHLFDNTIETESFPIGRPLSNYQNLVFDKFSQSVFIDQESELLIGGVGVFDGYFGRDDLTAKALVEIDGQLFYRTGDLVRMDNNGLLHYQGRKDHQIKLHGQRIELGEIERCLLNITSVSACVVMKWNDDYLVAYAQSSSHMNEGELRQHCQSHLPPHMIPSFFIILEKLPLNTNGKIDRKLLPPPHFSSIHLTNSIELLLPTNDIEVGIHHIWCEIFKQNQISTDTNIFTIGGHSLLMMQLFHQYKIKFHLQTNSLSISNLFQHPTIIHHAQLVQQSINTIHALDDYVWSSLHLTQARASFAQERIFLDEQIRFPSKHHNFMYVNPSVYRIFTTNNHLSIDRLHRALHTVVAKHRVLRTGFYLDINGMIIQYCLDINATINDQEPYGFSVVNINSDVKIDEVIQKIISRSDLFDLSKGRVLNCHIVHRHDFGDLSYNEDTLIMDDLIIFTIHHIVFDGASISTFLNDLSVAYTNDCSLPVDENVMQCIDSTVYERLMDMTQSHEFWYSQLKDYNFARSISLPFDRYCLSTDYRSGFQVVTEIYFDDDISAAFLEYATLHHITPFQLAMSIFYAFLFKLTDGQDDLCFSCLHANRHRTELQNIIGMFVATLPFRIQLNSQWSFEDLVKHVQENCLSIFQHTHYPLQYILADFRRNYSNVSFLDILFELVTVSPNINKLSLDESNLEGVSVEHLHEATYFDVDAVFVYNPTVETGKLLFNVYGSRDVFDETTVNTIGRKLQAVFSQIFTTKSRVDQIDKLSITLPDEVEHMQKVTFRHLSDMNNNDYQIKLHGQHVELGEIEQCLLNTSISACVIIKWDDDHLIAYVDGCDMTENELYEYCQSYLPFHMIPSMFILLEKLPRNDNGTIDQDLLRKSHLPTVINADSLSLIQLEARLSHIFSQVLGCESPEVTQSFSEMGGTSLDVLRMLSLIRKDICPIINGSLLFANPSIRQLARTIKPLLAMHEGVSVDSS
ncbi:unnamed protein product [Adineta steineri]|uniref:Carrier domain-containing protein n=1 Tax=Adineta steineri TaxID=433720 RepID=A0A815XUU6_9BILA|nr:unnamed protein product [Adineta steineri]CAF1562160.1 unnamed protein product [Adineta steineri]